MTTQLKNLSDANPNGTLLGQSASDKIAFYGSTPIVQPVGSGGVPVTTAAVSTSSWGFSTSTQANQVISAITALYDLGLFS
jgi:hypothetical protein